MRENLILSLIFISSLCFGCATPYSGTAYRSCPSYYSELKCLYWQSASSFYNKLQDDVTFARDKQLEHIDIVKDILILKDSSKIPQAYEVINQVLYRLKTYDGKNDLEYKRFSTAMISYSALVEATAEMRLRMGEMYVKLGDREKARETYRNVVITYTGEAYKSYVKKAEFALEDLKDK